MIKNTSTVIAALTASVSTLTVAAQPTQHKLPNIIYIMCDDMGYGDLGCYGQPYIFTPRIDSMAKEGCDLLKLMPEVR